MSRAGPVRINRAAIFLGLLGSFVAAVYLVRWIRSPLLLDSEPSWAVPRLLLGLLFIVGTASAGCLAAGAFWFFSSHWLGSLSPASLPWRSATLAGLAVAAIGTGTLLRFVALDRLPPSLWIDDVSLIAPALALRGSPADFANAIRPAPFGVAKPYGSVGVLYLELYRAALLLFGTTVFGVRFLSAAAGVASLVTAGLLGRSLLPRGGGALAALVLAGLRWNLLLSRWGWNAIVLAPVVDVAFLLLIRARRRESLLFAALAGIIAGVGAHIYLAAWIAAAALLAFALWPAGAAAPRRGRLAISFLFVVAFVSAAATLFLFEQGREAPYFARASDHNVLREMRSMRSPMPAFAAAADSLVSPWFKPDPFSHHDLPGKTRLGWILGALVALALARSLLHPAEDLSGFLLCHAGAALAASVAGGHAGVPNGYRFGYLADVAAVAAAAGILCILGGLGRQRIAALVAVGAIAVSGALSARDALLSWPQRRGTFDGFHGADTLFARAMLRWDSYGEVRLAPDLVHSPITVGAVYRYRLDPQKAAPAAPAPAGRTNRAFRVAPPGQGPAEGERAVERVRDAWGRDWAVVLAKAR